MADHFVCRCKAYSFPHQISKGKCSGAEWLRKYERELRERCQKCEWHYNRSDNSYCGLALDIEIRLLPRVDIAQCPAYLDEAKLQGVKP